MTIDTFNDRIYWVDLNTNKAYTADSDGNTVEEVVSTGLVGPSDILYHSDTLYIADLYGDAIYEFSASLRSGDVADGTELIGSPDINAPFGLAISPDGAYLYFTQQAAAQVRLSRLTVSNPSIWSQNFVSTSDLVKPSFIAADADWVYWTDEGAAYGSGTEDGALKRADTTDGSPAFTMISAGASDPSGIGLDDSGGLYWADATQNRIYRATTTTSGANADSFVMIDGGAATEVFGIAVALEE
jgi:sugar lactone lactonase YvrE